MSNICRKLMEIVNGVQTTNGTRAHSAGIHWHGPGCSTGSSWAFAASWSYLRCDFLGKLHNQTNRHVTWPDMTQIIGCILRLRKASSRPTAGLLKSGPDACKLQAGMAHWCSGSLHVPNTGKEIDVEETALDVHKKGWIVCVNDVNTTLSHFDAMTSCNRRWRDRFYTSQWCRIRIWSDFSMIFVWLFQKGVQMNPTFAFQSFAPKLLSCIDLRLHYVTSLSILCVRPGFASFIVWSSQVHGDVESVQLLLDSAADAAASDSAGEPLLCHALRNVLLGFQLGRCKLKTQNLRAKEWTWKVESIKSMFWSRGILSLSFFLTPLGLFMLGGCYIIELHRWNGTGMATSWILLIISWISFSELSHRHLDFMSSQSSGTSLWSSTWSADFVWAMVHVRFSHFFLEGLRPSLWNFDSWILKDVTRLARMHRR